MSTGGPPGGDARDHDAERATLHDCWEGAAAGWGRQAAAFGEQNAPVARWMIEAAGLLPGQRVLDLAAGPGEVGFLAAPLIEPGGTLISSDHSEAMVEIARKRAAELGLRNVEFRVLDGEWIDLELASLDVVLCRWGYMLMVDPAAAMRETRRVLRSGGRLALAVWDTRESNPWSVIPTSVLVEHGLAEPPVPGAPGPFAITDRALLLSMLEEAGFTDVLIDAVDVPRVASDFDSWWAMHLDLSAAARAAFQHADHSQTEAIEAELVQRLAPYTAPDGSLNVPGRTLVARALA
ncbi:MAG TPA: methyltransferase domain-containing protein [Solirubrobacteraceae bacterium]|nr:methyltransferase domain-containing protein [Solirubrobacteraceae bacterium]